MTQNVWISLEIRLTHGKSTLILCVCGLLSTSSHLIHNSAFTCIEIVLLSDYWLETCHPGSVISLFDYRYMYYWRNFKVKDNHGERKYA